MSAAAPKLTDQQRQAIVARGVAVSLDAGAGCGKTFVLSRRYLSHVASGAEGGMGVGQVVALTFTEAAAREMRDRIRKVCRKNFDGSVGDERAHWLGVLRTLDTARIGTIHGFCNELVTAHAIELGLSPGVRVMDAIAAAAMHSAAADRALRVLLDEHDEATVGLAVELSIDPLRSGALAMAKEAATPAFKRWLRASAEDMVAAWRQFYVGEVEPAAVRMVADGEPLRELIALLDIATPTERFIDRCTELFELTRDLGGEQPSVATARRLRELIVYRDPGAKHNNYSPKDWSSREVSQSYTDCCKRLREEIDKLLPAFDENGWLDAAERGLALLRIADRVAAEYRAAKRDTEAIDFDDLLSEAHRLLTDPRFAEVQQAARDGVGMLLIDEFQDTDPLQMEIVRALAGDAWTEGRLFFVGDFKQSIYRFRGAAPAVFRDLRDQTPERGRLVLSNNFRSTPGVLEFVNALFGPMFGNEYEPLRATRPQLTAGPAVEFLWTAGGGEDDKRSAGERRGGEARAIARRIADLIASGAPVVADAGGPRAARPGDFCILFRAITDVAAYEQALRDAGLPYYLVGGRAFYNQQEVFDVLNLLRSVVSTCDEVSLAGVLRSPFFSLADETLMWLVKRHGSLNRGLLARPPAEASAAERAKIERAAHTLAALRRGAPRLGAAGLLLEALDRTGYDAALTLDFLGERKQANLRKLIEQARDADAAPGGGLRMFVRQLSESVAGLAREAPASATASDADVVRLMTIHMSKGLEFPVVFVADLSRTRNKRSAGAVFDPRLGPLVRPPKLSDGERPTGGIDLLRVIENQQDLEEAQRVFYVACTRAADRLVLSASEPDLARPQGELMKMLAERFDVETGEPLGEMLEEPLVEVRLDDGRAAGQVAARSDRVDRAALAVEARAIAKQKSTVEPEGVAPVSVNPAAQQRFSVSRLTGRLHAYRPRGDDGAVIEDATPYHDKIDPAGLGTLVHELLERTPLEGDAPLAEWARDLAYRHTPFTPAAAAELAASLAGRFRASPRAERLRRARRVLREVEFLLPWSEPSSGEGVYLQGYLDSLCEEAPGHWRVVDYKTNDIAAAQAPKAAEEYRLQLGVYALAVERAWRAESIALTLHFLRPGVEVDFSWDAAARDATIRRVSELISELRAEPT